MTANNIIEDARVARVRELKIELAAAKARLTQAEADRDVLVSHLHLALMVLHDFERLSAGMNLRIIDGWNAILRFRNVSKLTSEDISRIKAEYLANLGIVPPPAKITDDGRTTTGDHLASINCQSPTAIWIVFDGPEENSFCAGQYRITYTGGTGLHRADRLILDYIHAVKLLGFDTSRIIVETGDKAFLRHICALGANAQEPVIERNKYAEKES